MKVKLANGCNGVVHLKDPLPGHGTLGNSKRNSFFVLQVIPYLVNGYREVIISGTTIQLNGAGYILWQEILADDSELGRPIFMHCCLTNTGYLKFGMIQD